MEQVTIPVNPPVIKEAAANPISYFSFSVENK